jgi:hypothetical protein
MKLSRWVAGAAALAVVVLTPVAASAAPAGPTPHFSATNLTPGSGAKLQALTYRADHDFRLSQVVDIFDVSDLAGVATVTVRPADDDTCTQSGTLITCPTPTLTSMDGHVSTAALLIKPVPGAAVGARGTIVVRSSSAQYPQGTTISAPVTIAEGVSLTSSPSAFVHNAALGTTVKNDLSVHNAGTNTVTGVQMTFFTDPWVPVAKKYSNCVYAVGAAYCDFDVDLAPGTTYRLSEPLGLVVRPDYPAPATIATTFTWRTPADNYDDVQLVRAAGGKAGNQGTLGLVAQRSVTSRGLPQTDADPNDSQAVTIHVQGRQTADLAAVGARATGAVGSTVRIKVGARNLGPAFVPGIPSPAAAVQITPPTGTKVVSVPAGCELWQKGYRCLTTAASFNPRTTQSWEFPLRIDKAGTLTGKVVITRFGNADPKPANDTADIVISQPAAGGTGGGGPGLPITGAPAGAVAATGVLLLVTGVLMLFVGRRRRIA